MTFFFLLVDRFVKFHLALHNEGIDHFWVCYTGVLHEDLAEFRPTLFGTERQVIVVEYDGYLPVPSSIESKSSTLNFVFVVRKYRSNWYEVEGDIFVPRRHD